MYERLLSILNGVASTKVLVVGDFMIDEYTYGDMDRISPEAPVPIIKVTERQERPGGAGSVAVDLAALQAEVSCVGVVGDDINGRRLKQMLGDLQGVNAEGLINADDRCTTGKQRIIGLAQHRHRQQLMRIDSESAEPIGRELQAKLLKHIDGLAHWCDVVCLEDYGKGVLCAAFCQQVIAAAKRNGKRTIIDPAMLDDYGRYAGAWLIKPNRRELSLATGVAVDGAESWRQAAAKLAQEHDIDNVVVTLDKQGSYLYQHKPEQGAQALAELIPTRPRNVYDVTGAGDIVLAMMALLLGGSYEQIAQPSLGEVVCLANVAGGLEVERFGSVGISRNEIAAELVRERRAKTGKLRSVEALLRELQWHRQQRLKVVFTNGCFDILHPGHINLLSFAKEQGDVLVVAMNSDRSVRQLKGPTRPILKEHDRAALLSALEPVDYIVIFDEETPLGLIEQVRPEVLVKGTDWTGKVVGQDWVEQHGGKVVLAPLTAGRSTTGIIQQVIEQNNDGKPSEGGG